MPGIHTVTVTATDPAGGTGAVVVTVAVKDVNEAPTITTGPTRALPEDDENIATTIVVGGLHGNRPRRR